MQYTLMRKNTPLVRVEITAEGRMEWFERDCKEPELLPLQNRLDSNGLRKWWKTRAVPIKQGKIAEMLAVKGIATSEEYLTRNLGLSLTDYYWIRPIDSDLMWEDVNLFDNTFQNEMTIDANCDECNTVTGMCSPNSSLQGGLEKKWIIINGKRYLVKGNYDNTSSESINEVIATMIHEKQGFTNYTPYKLIKVKKRDYDYGCICETFTSQKRELVPAYDIVTSMKKRNDISMYEHFINVGRMYGIDSEELRRNLEYQIQIDFIISGRDRHLNNIAIIRDADTLEFKQMAPIFDSGRSLFVHQDIPYSNYELLNLKTESFASSELQLLSYVQDRSLVDVSKLPGRESIARLYSYDSQMPLERVNRICDAYERKVELYRDFQLGKDLNRIKIALKPEHSVSQKVNKMVVFTQDTEN